MKLPKIRNEVEFLHIDGTPKGYALRILKCYREYCNTRWIVSGPTKKENIIYDLMNEHQVERAKELDKAIKILEKGN